MAPPPPTSRGWGVPSGLMSHQQPLLTSWAALLGSDIGFMSLHFTAVGRSGHPDICHSAPPSRSIETTGSFFFLFLSRYVGVVKKTSGPSCRPRSIVETPASPPVTHRSTTCVLCCRFFPDTMLQTPQPRREMTCFKNSCVNWSLFVFLQVTRRTKY